MKSNNFLHLFQQRHNHAHGGDLPQRMQESWSLEQSDYRKNEEDRVKAVSFAQSVIQVCFSCTVESLDLNINDKFQAKIQQRVIEDENKRK